VASNHDELFDSNDNNSYQAIIGMRRISLDLVSITLSSSCASSNRYPQTQKSNITSSMNKKHPINEQHLDDAILSITTPRGLLSMALLHPLDQVY
jgi:hypothetical protein